MKTLVIYIAITLIGLVGVVSATNHIKDTLNHSGTVQVYLNGEEWSVCSRINTGTQRDGFVCK